MYCECDFIHSANPAGAASSKWDVATTHQVFRRNSKPTWTVNIINKFFLFFIHYHHITVIWNLIYMTI